MRQGPLQLYRSDPFSSPAYPATGSGTLVLGRAGAVAAAGAWGAGSPDALRKGMVPRGGFARRRIRPNIIWIAQPLVRRMFWVRPIIPTICMYAGFMPTLVFRRHSATASHSGL